MPISYTILSDVRVVLTIWDGRVTRADWKAHLTSLMADPIFDATSLHLADVRSADVQSTIGPEDIDEIVRFLTPHRPRLAGRKVAILAGKDLPKSNLVAGLVGTLGLTIATFVFSGTAVEWLELSPSTVEPRLQELRKQIPPTS
jgi:hypothetical protein